MKRIAQACLFLLLAALLAAPPVAGAASREFRKVVKIVKSYYHVRPQHRLLIDAAMAFAPKEAGKVELAVFEDQEFSAKDGGAGLEARIQDALGPKWSRLVQVRSKREGLLTHIYVREDRGQMKLLVVNIEPQEGAVVMVKVTPEQLEALQKEL